MGKMVKMTDKARRLTRTDYLRLAEFRHILRRFLVFSGRAAEHAGLIAQQHQALLAIKGYPGPGGHHRRSGNPTRHPSPQRG